MWRIMAIYEYSCKECKIIWECDFPFAKQEKKTPCPECNADCGQNWDRGDIPVHFKGAGWTGVNKRTGYNKIGGSDEVNLRLQDETKKRMETGWQHYARYTPPQKVLDQARKLTPTESANKMKVAKKIMDETYDRAKIDPTNIYKPQ